MFEQVRWQRAAWLPVTAGLVWLWCAARLGAVGFVFSACRAACSWPPASRPCSTRATSASRSSRRWAACSASSSPCLRCSSPAGGRDLLCCCCRPASFVAAGATSVQPGAARRGRSAAAAFAPSRRPGRHRRRLSAAWWCRIEPALADPTVRLRQEMHEARDLFRARGWLDRPESYHTLPPPLTETVLRAGALAPARLRARSSSTAATSPTPTSPGATAGWRGAPTAPPTPGSCATPASRARG